MLRKKVTGRAHGLAEAVVGTGAEHEHGVLGAAQVLGDVLDGLAFEVVEADDALVVGGEELRACSMCEMASPLAAWRLGVVRLPLRTSMRAMVDRARCGGRR